MDLSSSRHLIPRVWKIPQPLCLIQSSSAWCHFKAHHLSYFTSKFHCLTTHHLVVINFWSRPTLIQLSGTWHNFSITLFNHTGIFDQMVAFHSTGHWFHFQMNQLMILSPEGVRLVTRSVHLSLLEALLVSPKNSHNSTSLFNVASPKAWQSLSFSLPVPWWWMD